MSTKHIYIIRHGETDFNKNGIVQGSGVDAPLNELGLKQAQLFFEKYKEVPFQKVYTSTLIRTHQTAQPFIDLGLDWIQHQGLNEICWGIREGKKPDYQDNIQFSQMMRQWNAGHTHLAFEQGESPLQVSERQMMVFEEIIADTTSNPILIAMHGRALKILMAKLIHDDLSKMDHFEHSNLCLYLVKYHYQSQKFEMVLANDISHLQ